MATNGVEFLGVTQDGKFQYRNNNGKIFTSKKQLHDDPTLAVSKIINSERVEETDVDQLSQAFGKTMQKKSGKENGEMLKEVFRDALMDVTDKNVSEEQVNEQTLKIISKLEQAGILFQVENNKGLQKKVLLNAEEKLMNEIEVSKNKQSQRLQDATYRANEFAANIYGIDSGRPKWQLALARSGANVFFMIWFIVSTITFTPIMFFLTMIGVQVKSSPLKWLFTILIYFTLILFMLFVTGKIVGPDNWASWPNN
jgi:hypothetical protein